uniref:Peptidase S1 domain-containing protein n=1 Tax=Glossina brevipalpis TaxID=37001 RepID=A0A1A9WVH4_9MUSC
MFNYFFFVLISVSVTFTLPLNDEYTISRIVNGTETIIENHPYQVSLQVSGKHLCGGSILKDDIVITAAHCIKGLNISDFKIRLGSTYTKEGGILIDVKTFKYHKGFRYDTLMYDVGVIKLAKSINQSSTIRYIELANEVPKSGTIAIVSGWGRTCSTCNSSNVLRDAEVAFLRRKDCASETYLYGEAIKDTMVCAYTEGKDACIGDSGGPLVVDGKLVGTISWGDGCAEIGYPGVYADVIALRDWILETAEKL